MTGDQAGDALDDARQLAAQGKFAEALERHIWFHDHALELEPSYYGVRLSFALADWVELGQKFPKAIDALKDIRDNKTSRLIAGQADRSLFHDVKSINDQLGESKATAELFKKLAATQSEFAASVYHLADEALIEAEEFALARKYLGDPMVRLSAAKVGFGTFMKFGGTLPRDDPKRQALETIFTDDVVRIIVVLDKTDDRAGAREIQSKALEVLQSAAIRNAIGN